MPLVKLERACLAFGHVPLLDDANLQIDAGERVCLVGRNGAGKSSLMRAIGDELPLDGGDVWRQPGLRLAHVAQDAPTDDDDTVYDVVASGLQAVGRLLADYHHASSQVARAHSAALAQHLAELQHAIEVQNGWRLEQRVDTVITRLGLAADAQMKTLSGGYKRKALLARALVSEPELLLLDEPTNHLDIAAIGWLEEFLLGHRGAVLFITHDRTFARHLATRIVELDRGRLTSWPGDYARYLRRKDELLAIEQDHNAAFDKRLGQEEIWIRQGIKARRKRNQGRVRALQALREQRRRRRELMDKTRMQLDRGEASARVVIEAEGVIKSFDGKTILKRLSTTIQRGDRVGIVGPNGAGKSTLLKLLLGEMAPDSGRVTLGKRLQVAYFDQERTQLDPEQTVADCLNDRSEFVLINGRSRHVIGYLRDFLFPPESVRSPIKTLSGGERNRLLLARLFMQPANLLVLDEPTNDLDVETLELLEELLAEYDGTVILVSHDRAFLDNVVTSTLVFEGDGRVGEYVGGYEDWLRQRTPPAVEPPAVRAAPAATGAAPRGDDENPAPKKKLGYKEQRELEALPGRIEALEHEQRQIGQRVSQSEFYQQDKAAISGALARLKQLRAELERAYARWEHLEGLVRQRP